MEIILVNPTETGGVGAELGNDALGHLRCDETEPFADALACEVIVDGLIENDGDERKPEHGVRAYGLDGGESLKIDGEGIGDLVLDLLRAASWPIGVDEHLILAEIRDGIDGSGAEGSDAEGNQK